MDGRKKRKSAPGATPGSSEGAASKKLKLLNSNSRKQHVDVQGLGKKLLEQLRNATDKNGNPISEEFAELPSRAELPHYYETIKLPVSFSIIEAKLDNDLYPTMTTLESDLKRMIQNAKEFNKPNSDIPNKAEKIRKRVYDFMKIHNPEYRSNPRYTSFPTPIPPDEGAGGAQTNAAGTTTTPATPTNMPKSVPKIRLKASEARTPSAAPSTGTADGDDNKGVQPSAELNLTGLSFQDAQRAIISYLITYVNEEGLMIYDPFVSLPSRRLEDYYRIIKNPVSLKSLLNKCKGQRGRAGSTGVSDFKTWDEFETAVSGIWKNAQEYNEDGSDLFLLANEFKDHFYELLEQAKGKVEGPSTSSRIKIAPPKPKVVLNASQPQTAVGDSGAGQQQTRAASLGVNHEVAPVAATAASEISQPVLLPPGSATSARESMQPAAPNSYAMPRHEQPEMLTPAAHLDAFNDATNSAAHPHSALVGPPSRAAKDSTPFDMALLPSVWLVTIPPPHLASAFGHIVADPDLTQQSVGMLLGSEHQFIKIAATVSEELTNGWPYKLFVLINGLRVNQKDTQYNARFGIRSHIYEGTLTVGMSNRIQVEIVAAKHDGSEHALDREMALFLVHLNRS
ncbi:Bromodomain-containing protein [Piedraia hortae CBS 480.64]|uniref:Bromodomain-containing protein n=1 Tax=Piedraia hortae CBS 480.64 TaxID=1314780 RepID=A0A6A7BRB4_9PEZI|nr:Bromodomain-containing protein [Piedraia hortae CBS 480.64]